MSGRCDGTSLGSAGFAVLESLDEFAVATHHEHDAYEGEEYHSHSDDSQTSTMGVGGLDALGLFGYVVMVSAGGSDVVDAVGNGDKVDVIAHGVLSDNDNLSSQGVDAEGVVVALETGAGDGFEAVETLLVSAFDRIHAYHSEVGGVFLGAGKDEDAVFEYGNRPWTEDVDEVVASDVAVGGETAYSLQAVGLADEEVNSTVDAVDDHEGFHFRDIADLVGGEVH